ncbi:uridine-cytidine kinase-like 1 [Limulus polyphemus]|uniref:Uridine kinase n=1 Tax=Limulus polyphemus TaxID=6850 RepID=A0ABM1TH19_LIMPO|nr:uridine-cytidine kinase-like 1 [Limulus polyphemus]
MAETVVGNAPSSASSESDSSDELGFENVGRLDVNEDLVQKGSYPPSPQGSQPLSPLTPCTPHCLRTKREKNRSCSKSGSSREPVLRSGQRTIYTAGRPPWYDTQGQLVEPFVIGICGGSSSGKTTVARKIIEALDVPWVTLLSMDSFYKVLDEEQHKLAHENEYNFDHPDAFDFSLLIETLRKLKEGKRVQVPIYNFVTHAREKRMKTMYGANVIIFEGILCFAHKGLLEIMDMKVFIDTDSDIRLVRRLKRDIMDRGRDLEGVLKQYNRFVKPAFDHYIAPTMIDADLIVPRGK